MSDTLTRVDTFGDWYCKREDLACYERIDWPTGAKVRQYTKMIQKNPAPLLVGCSAFSAMQIYIAAAAEKFNLNGIVYIPARAAVSDATRYAQERGVEVCEVRPCPGPSVYRARAKKRGELLGPYVHWDFTGAIDDAMYQTQNIPQHVRRILIPTGSGLISSGVLAGLAGRDIKVISLAGSTMADSDTIIANAKKALDRHAITAQLPEFELIRLPEKYEHYAIAALPDGTPLDPFYAAKTLKYVHEGDCLWLTGLRPVCSMPEKCQKAFHYFTDETMRDIINR